jgi:DNA-binding MarR family transcriptional regulator
MEKSNLSFSQVNVLMRLFHGAKCGVSMIGEEMGVSNAAASQAVDRLVQMGLIERTEDPSDRRSKRLALTREGKILIESGIYDRSQWIKDLAVTLTKEQQKTIIEALTILTETARKDEN